MKPITLKDLKGYQTRAAGALSAMIQEFPGGRYKPRFDAETGVRLPFLCRLRAITGAGKTPILAVTAKQLGNAVILWTTNRSAIIAQTKANLLPGGRYADLLPEGTSIYEIGEMGPQDWTDSMQATEGLTILLATVASFIQDGDKLKIHQDRNGTTYWKMLGGIGEEGRKRALYVFYDEGHGATVNQFRRLRELSPKAFVLASASPLPDEFNDMLPGATMDEKAKSLESRTVPVPTQEVVAAGLLKTRLYLVDCNVSQADAVTEAHQRWEALAAKFAKLNGEVPAACFIVNETVRGVDIWEELVALGVPPGRIAVHLNGAEAVMYERRGDKNGLIDTYKAKKAPEDLKAEGYTHLIWNLTLREGWDEPMAYVAYIDDKGRSINDMVQKIGRFVRQPGAKPFDDPDLNSAYFYFNVTDQQFGALIRDMQAEMTVEGYEVIAIKSDSRPKFSRLVDVKEEKTVPEFGWHFGSDLRRLDKIILDNVPRFDPIALQAEGFTETRVFDVQNLDEDTTQRTRAKRDNNAAISVFDFLMNRLTAIDTRIGDRFTHVLRDEQKMRQQIQFGSEAMAQMNQYAETIRDRLNEEFQITPKGRRGVYSIKPFNLVTPNITGVNEATREKYKVRRYEHAVHAEYNGFNPFETEVAAALDQTGLPWCRNPSKTGYGIPVTELGADVTTFYPDFLLWTEKEIWAIDPKGAHIKEAAIQNKLFDVVIEGVSTPVRVVLILQGEHKLTVQGDWVSSKEDAGGFTSVRRVGAKVKHQYFSGLPDLLASLTTK